MDKKTTNLIEFIVCYATEQDIHLTPVRLVKFLYLSDYYYARWNQGKKFTDLPWYFHHFGPYCAEALDHISEAVSAGLISADNFSSSYTERDYVLFSCRDTHALDELERRLPPSISSELKGTIRRFGEDTASLLDYVYFETEPMEDIRAESKLDFSTVRAPIKRKKVLPRMSKKSIENARALIHGISETQEKERNASSWRGEIKDDVYHKGIEILNKADEIPTGIEGIAKIEEE